MRTSENWKCRVVRGFGCLGILILGMLLGRAPSTQAQTSDQPTTPPSSFGNQGDTFASLNEQMKQDALKWEKEKKEFERQKDLERVSVLAHNYSLASAVAEFQRHISDMHHRHVACKLCNGHVKKIKGFTKKIDQAMK